MGDFIMNKKTITLFEVRSQLEVISNKLWNIKRNGNNIYLARQDLDILISNIQKAESKEV